MRPGPDGYPRVPDYSIFNHYSYPTQTPLKMGFLHVLFSLISVPTYKKKTFPMFSICTLTLDEGLVMILYRTNLHICDGVPFTRVSAVIRGLPVSPMNNFSFASAPLGFQHGNAARPLSNIQSIMATYHVEVFNTRTSIFSSDRPSST